MERREVFERINSEMSIRYFPPREIGSFLLMMEHYLDSARSRIAAGEGRGDGHALGDIVKVLGIGVACMEQHVPGAASAGSKLTEKDLRKIMTEVQAEGKQTQHDIDKAQRRCRKCGMYERDILGRPNVCSGFKSDEDDKPINPTVRHSFGKNGKCEVCGGDVKEILSKSSPTPCVPLTCNLCNEPLGPGDRDNHLACMIRENHGANDGEANKDRSASEVPRLPEGLDGSHC